MFNQLSDIRSIFTNHLISMNQNEIADDGHSFDSGKANFDYKKH